MATRTKPLISTALAGAAAIAVASPVIAPNASLPSPSALSKAVYELTTFSDLLSIPPVVWTDVLFGNDSWGGTLSATTYGPDFAAPGDAFGQYGYVNPWAVYCDGTCFRSGLGGLGYLITDALFNGNGNGYDDYANWKIGVVNYFWEPNSVFQIGAGQSPTLQFVDNGLSAASWYLLQATVGQVIPGATVPLAAAYWGPNNVSVFYNLALSIAAVASGVIPLVGPLVGNSILAYLGDLALEQGTQATYQFGLSGALNYWVDIATGAVPWPTKVPWYTISPATAAAVPAAASTVRAAHASVSESTESETESTGSETESTGAETESPDTSAPTDASNGASGSPETGPKGGASEDSSEAPEVEVPDTESDDVETVESPEVKAEAAPAETPAAPAIEIPAAEVAATAPASAPAAPKRQRPVRDAMEKVGSRITSAIADAKAAKAERVQARKDRAAAK